MVMLSKFANFADKLSENDELRKYELSGSDCIFVTQIFPLDNIHDIFQ